MKVLVVDDDPDIVEAVSICFALRWPDAEVVDAPDGTTALTTYDAEDPDVIILDLGLPDMNGLEVCKSIREVDQQLPILILTARGGEFNKVEGFNAGADDYITKPFSHLELLARIKAVVRRATAPTPGGEGEPFEEGEFKFDFAAHRVYAGGTHVQLTKTEYGLLFHLTKNFPNVVQHKTLLAKVWGREYVDETDYLKVHVQRIRRKFAEAQSDLDPIATERGIGYRLSPEGN
ncbi:response regulator transcription factor [Candidatus Lucifugimonas marina]|uniref:Response regulator n=1 Tax=Candidatus Lucifugimonas marina TaxID=3038979 RepID=A0AAJ6CSD8_9CHLR|nr:response regulator [SAR202 cluster bacterium JH702]MDG0869515.1 response regulator [SAR202 cluster bacterium JH639]WFG34252.1 response regulator [SAR202 cluster bacterium JH545]WFG38182.1 response regulator [SAR202 cluster bacterium JH1073]